MFECTVTFILSASCSTIFYRYAFNRDYMRGFWKAEKGIEMNYYGRRQDVDGSMFGKFLQFANCIPRARHGSYFKHCFFLVTFDYCLLKGQSIWQDVMNDYYHKC